MKSLAPCFARRHPSIEQIQRAKSEQSQPADDIVESKLAMCLFREALSFS